MGKALCTFLVTPDANASSDRAEVAQKYADIAAKALAA